MIPFTLFFSILAITGLHGTSIPKIGLILLINYAIAKRAGKLPASGPILTWTFNAAILFLNETCDGYRFASLSKHLAFLVRVFPVRVSTILDLTTVTGHRVSRRIPSLAHTIQHHYATPYIL